MRRSILLACLIGCQSPTSNGNNNQIGTPTAPTGALFSKPQAWTRDVSSIAKSAESDAIIGALDAAGGWGIGRFQTDISIELLSADDSTPYRTITPSDDFFEPDCDNVQFPLPPGGALEGEDGYACDNDGDCHLLVVAKSKRKLYEMWRANVQGNTFNAGCVAVWDLDKQYDDTLRGKGCTSADAGGFPIAAMLATADEAAAGEINHALRFILPNARIRKGIYVPPGTHSTQATTGGPNLPPYGVRFRLKASFDENSVNGAGTKAIVRALKKYGMFLADGGRIPLTVASDRFSTAKWDDLGFTSQSLNAIKVTDFEVVEHGNPVDWLADTDCVRND